ARQPRARRDLEARIDDARRAEDAFRLGARAGVRPGSAVEDEPVVVAHLCLDEPFVDALADGLQRRVARRPPRHRRPARRPGAPVTRRDRAERLHCADRTHRPEVQPRIGPATEAAGRTLRVVDDALKAVSDAVLAIAAERSVDEVLQRLVDAARELADARYAA